MTASAAHQSGPSSTTVRQQPLTAIDAPISASSSTSVRSDLDARATVVVADAAHGAELLDDAGEHLRSAAHVRARTSSRTSSPRRATSTSDHRRASPIARGPPAANAGTASVPSSVGATYTSSRSTSPASTSAPATCAPPSNIACSTPSPASVSSVAVRSTPVPFGDGGSVSTFAPAASHALAASSGTAAVVSTSVGASSVSNKGPDCGHAPARVEQHAQRLALDRRVDVARGQRRTIGERGARADHDRLRLRAHARARRRAPRGR